MGRSTRLWRTLAPALILAALLLPLLAPLPARAQERLWTIMVYMSGDNDLEAFSLADLDEMERGLAGGQGVTVVVLADRASAPYESQEGLPSDVAEVVESSPQWDTARLLLVEADSAPGVSSRMLEDWGEADMGDPATLSRFVRYVAENFPAQHYMLVFWDHGGGPGIFDVDEDNGGSYLTLREASDALKAAGVHFDIIGFDACLMASVDTAYELRDLADYLVASEETEPGDGWPYDSILAKLSSNPGMGPRELASAVVRAYMDFYRSIGMPGVTLSAIDLSVYRDPGFLEKVRSFADAAASNPQPVQQARLEAQTFGGGNDPVYGANQVDALDLLSRVSDTVPGAGELASILKASIVYSDLYGAQVSGARGITLHYPLRYDRSIYVEMTSFSTDAGWAELLEVLVNVEAEVQPPQQGEIQLVKLFEGMADQTQLMAAGPVDFDGDGAQEFIVYAIGYTASSDEYSVLLSISKYYADAGLVEVYSDMVDWGYPDEQGNPPFSIADAMSGDVDGDGMEEFLDAYSYVDLSTLTIYTSIDKYEYLGEASVSSSYGIIDNLVATASDLGDLEGDGSYEVLVGGYELNPDTGELSGALYLVSADTLEVLASYTLDAPQDVLVDVPGIAVGDLIPGHPGDEVVLAYNMYQLDYYGNIIPVGYRFLLATVDHGDFRVLGGYEEQGSALSLDVGDLDSDGVDEIILVHRTPEGAELAVYRATDQGLAVYGSWGVKVSPEGTAVAEAYDIDGDGIVEMLVAVAEPSGQGVSAVLEIYAFLPSTGELRPEGSIDLSGEYAIPVPADLTGDGVLEVVYLVQLQDGVYLGAGVVENYVDPTGEVRGVVLDAEGNPVPGAKVKLSLPRTVSMKTVADENGRFNFTGVPAGSYQVEAYWRKPGGVGYAVMLVTVEPGAAVEIILQEEAEAMTTTTTTTTTPATTTTTMTTTATTTTTTTTTTTPPTETTTTIQPIQTTTATIGTTTTTSPTETTTPVETTATAQPTTTTAATTSQTGQTTPPAGDTTTPTTTSQPLQTTHTTPLETTATGQGQTPATPSAPGEGTGYLPVLVAVQAATFIILIIAFVALRFRRGAAALLVLFILCLPYALQPLHAAAQHVAQPPWWAYKGLRVAYQFMAGETIVSPWVEWRNTLDEIQVMGGGNNAANQDHNQNNNNNNQRGVTVRQGGAGDQNNGDGDEKIDITVPVPKKPNNVSIIGGFEVYIVEDAGPGFVDTTYYTWMTYEGKPLLGLSRSLPLRNVPRGEVFNGPFWIDSRLVANVRTGDRIPIPAGDRVVEYTVLFAGRLDISPFNEGEGSLRSVIGFGLNIPVPRGTYRDVVVLQGEIRAQNQQTPQRHTMAVDRELGLIYYEAYGSVSGGVNQQGQLTPVKNVLYVRTLAEITLDLEETLPPYANFPQDPLIHAGYNIFENAAFLSLSVGMMFTYAFTIGGVYKDTIIAFETIHLSVNEAAHQETAAWKISLRNGVAEVIFSRVFASTVSSQPIFRPGGSRFERSPLWIGDAAGHREVEIMGTKYVMTDMQTQSLEGLGEVTVYRYSLEQPSSLGLEFAELYFLPNGLLYMLEPSYQGLNLFQQPNPANSMITSIPIITRIPNTAPQTISPTPPQTETTNQTTTSIASVTSTSTTFTITEPPTASTIQGQEGQEQAEGGGSGSSQGLYLAAATVLAAANIVMAAAVVMAFLKKRG